MSKPTVNLNSGRAWVTFVTIGILLIGFTVLWIINSYHKVTFIYDSDLGSVTLIKPNSSDQPIKVKSEEPLNLREGDYILKRNGEDIINSEQTITVTKDETIEIDLYYTDTYLEDLYSFERINIEQSLYEKYPIAQEIYNLRNGRLYSNGTIYGATLVHIDDKDQNRDSLKVIMKKEGEQWELITDPPTPILSQPLYPEVPLDIVTQINRAR